MTTPSYVDEKVLSRLLSSLSGDQDGHRDFVHNFVSLWDTRAQRLAAAMVRPDFDAADIVLLSIRSSSVMIGASALAEASETMRGAVRVRDRDACRTQISEIFDLGKKTMEQLEALMPGLLRRGGGA